MSEVTRKTNLFCSFYLIPSEQCFRKWNKYISSARLWSYFQWLKFAIFSSGVKLPHKVILNRLNWQFKAFPYSDTEKVCVFKTALTFVDSVSEIWGPLMKGLSLLVIPKEVTKDPERLIEALEKYKVRFTFSMRCIRMCFTFVRKFGSFLQSYKDDKNGKQFIYSFCCISFE